jgi:extracellular elastinolytic metalloproteinase
VFVASCWAIYIERPYALRGTLYFASAAFGLPYLTPRCVPGEIVIADPIDACSPLHNVQSYVNKIVLVKRGICTFASKAKRVQEQGGSGMIVWNGISDEFHHMSDDGTIKNIRIRSVLITHDDGEKIYNYLLSNISSVKAMMGYCPFLSYNYYS